MGISQEDAVCMFYGRGKKMLYSIWFVLLTCGFHCSMLQNFLNSWQQIVSFSEEIQRIEYQFSKLDALLDCNMNCHLILWPFDRKTRACWRPREVKSKKHMAIFLMYYDVSVYILCSHVTAIAWLGKFKDMNKNFNLFESFLI